jgi:hypothetical protein
MLSLEDKQHRLAFCTALLAFDGAWFARLVFSDEKYFTLRFGQQTEVWQLPDADRHRKLTVQHPPKSMLWLGMGPGWTSYAF